MTKLLDKLFEFCASLKLAISLILSLAFYLGSATVYEARYGTRAVQDVIYGSRPFILLMAMLSINVMAAVLVRYPWKRKQTGFIITHCGIEILLLGCLISFRYSVDGKVSLQPGQKSEVINLNDEEVGVTIPDAGGKPRRHVFPISLWKDAGYPGLARFVAGSVQNLLPGDVHLIDLPSEARWPEGHTVEWPMGDGAKLRVLDWQPAAVPENVIEAKADGFPAVTVHLGGAMMSGMPLNQDIPLLVDHEGHGLSQPFNAIIDLTFWKARSEAEVEEFLHPARREDLPEMGRIAIHIDGRRYALDVTKDTLEKEQPLGDSGYKATVAAYALHPDKPRLPENHGQAAIDLQPIEPEVELHLIGPNGKQKYLLDAWHPQFMAHLDTATPGGHGAAEAKDPLIWYSHPQTYFTTKAGTRGRLQLLQSQDGKLYGRFFELQDRPDQKPLDPFEVQLGKPLFWKSISVAVTQHCPSGALVHQFRPAHVEPRQMDEHGRAIHLALDVDGQKQDTWLQLGETAPVELSTPRGPVMLDYSYHEFPLEFAVGLKHAEQKNDPGSDNPAAYTSEVEVSGSGKQDGSHTLTMNVPMTVNGLTFYQAGFQQLRDDAGDVFPISTLSVRRDPGWVIKYLGCALIVGGIFTMFYMKAYFQKSSVPAAPMKALPAGGTIVRPPPFKGKAGHGPAMGAPSVARAKSGGAPKTA